MIVWMWLACGQEPLPCGTGTHEEDGACVADDEDPVGNYVRLDEYPPVVVSTSPVSGDVLVSAALDAIEVTFSRPMADDSWSWVQADFDFPEAGEASCVTATTNVLSDVQLEAAGEYLVWVNDPFHTYENFVSDDGEPALAYPIAFAVGDGSDPDMLIGAPAAVVSTIPAVATETVSPDLARIEVTFSKDMSADDVAFVSDDDETWPEVHDSALCGARTACLDVTLEPSTTYAIWVGREDGELFADSEGVEAAPYLLTFRTADPE